MDDGSFPVGVTPILVLVRIFDGSAPAERKRRHKSAFINDRRVHSQVGFEQHTLAKLHKAESSEQQANSR